MEVMILNVEKCPHGLVNGECKTVDCLYQEGKWKGEVKPSFSIEDTEKPGEYKITCDDAEE